MIATLLTTVAGAGLLARDLAGAGSEPTSIATLGGLTVRLRAAGWAAMDTHDMDQQDGYQMPAQMMPGAPTGEDMRLGVTLSLDNTSGQARRFDLGTEFSLIGGTEDKACPLHSDTFGQLPRIEPGNAVDGVLYFDTTVPAAADPPLYLRWARDGHTARLAIPIGGAQPAHTHDGH
jgi:hypothetical protein